MKLQILSDLHLEGWNYKIDLSQFECDSDIIILAGDIGVGEEAIHWAEELGKAMQKPVVFVAGNHEFYKHDINTVRKYYQSFSDNSNHVIYLDNNQTRFNDGVEDVKMASMKLTGVMYEKIGKQVILMIGIM